MPSPHRHRRQADARHQARGGIVLARFRPSEGWGISWAPRRGWPDAASSSTNLDLVLSTAQDPQATGALVRYFYDGRAPRTLARRANRDAIVRDDERVLTMVDVDGEWLGALTVVDSSSAKALQLDERVTVASERASWSHPTEAGAVIYGVVDGERTGVWVARPK